MKIIVFGASGGTGQEIVAQGIAHGHTVTAFVRNPDGLTRHAACRVITGDIFDAAAVADAIAGHSAVLSALGPRSLKKEDLLARTLPKIAEGMQRHYVNRTIVLGAAGADRDYGKYQNRLTTLSLWVAKHTRFRYPYADQAEQERILAASDLDYTIVRPPRLTDGPITRTYRVTPDALPSGGRRISRADVADFMLQQLTDPRFHRQGPYIADL